MMKELREMWNNGKCFKEWNGKVEVEIKDFNRIEEILKHIEECDGGAVLEMMENDNRILLTVAYYE